MIYLAKKKGFSLDNKGLLVIALSILVVPVVLYFLLTGGKAPSFTGAWDCDKYNIHVAQNGLVTVDNQSAYAEPATGIEVYINDVLVSRLSAPALSPGQKAEIGKVSVPSNGVFRWRAIATADRRCEDSGEYTGPPPVACKIGYVFTRQRMSENYPGIGYISGDMVMNNKPEGAEVVKYDLFRGSPIGPTTLKDQDIKVLVLGVTNQPVGSRRPLTSRELFTSAELNSIRDAYRSGVHVIAAGDNGSTSEGIDDAASELIQLNGFLQPFVSYSPEVIYVPERVATRDVSADLVWGPRVPFITTITTDTTKTYRTPGVVRLVSSDTTASSCFEQITQRNGTTRTCLAYYVWPRMYSGYTVNSGFMYIDSNGGKTLAMTPDLLRRLLAEACK